MGSAAAMAGRDGAGDAPAWTRFVATAAAAAAGLFLVLWLALALVDPYGTGRPGLIRSTLVHDQYPFTAHASRARNPLFDAAILGNSHVQMLRPERLDGLTGLRFVSLTVPASWPADQVQILRWMEASRAAPPRLVVFGIDHFWCLDHTGHVPSFPDWLYSPNPLRYLAGLVRYRAFEAAAARLRVLATGRGAARQDGYWDYGPDYAARGLAARGPSHAKLAERLAPTLNPAGRYPALEELRRALAGLPAATAVVLLRPPVYRTGLPEPGSVGDAHSRRCGAELAALAVSRPRTAVLDLFRPGPLADDPDGFYDHRHYRDPQAAEVERLLAATVRPLLPAPETQPLRAGP